MSDINYLVLDQYREQSEYNDFLGKFYHFPEKYLNYFKSNTEFVYYEPKKRGKGIYFGFGKILKKPFKDKREPKHYFVEISDYKSFSIEVPFELEGNPRETAPYYNSQNAVRRIKQNTLEEICLDGGILLNFKADAHLIKVLGEQLIASEKVGILELVKNAIDANASYCKVRIEKIPTLPQVNLHLNEFNEYEGPVIIVEDDGVGMSREVIENGWLRPASTIKTNVKERLREEKNKALESGKLGAYQSLVNQLKKEYKNRIPLGEKGVGRFATHRLGSHLILKTKVEELDYEYVLKIDWDNFDKIISDGINLDSIGISLTRQKPSRDYGKRNSGTQLIIYGGREGFEWTKNKIEIINQSILRLNSPNPQPGNKNINFQAFLECPQIEDLSQKQIYEEFTPIFNFEILVDEDGFADSYTIKFKPPKSVPMGEDKISGKNFDLKAAEKEYWKDSNGLIRKPQCGPFYMYIDVWYRRKPWIDGPDFNLMVDYLDEYGGISIYRDDVLIFPAESGTKFDWLGLTLHQIKQGFRISYYEMIGNIEINQTSNIDLIDKTNREGMVENKSFLDLSILARAAIKNLLEVTYIAKRDEYNNLTKGITRDPKELIDVTKQGSKLVEGIRNNYPVEADPQNILKFMGNKNGREAKLINLSYSLKNLKKSLELMEEVQEILSEQAGYGIAVAVSVHEIAKITANFYQGLSEVLRSNQPNKEKLENLRDASKSLNSELKRLGPLRAIRNERRSTFNIQKSINFVYEVFKRKMEKENIDFEVNKKEDFEIYARYGAINQVLSNLIDNSIYWLDTRNIKNRKIIIKIDSTYRTLLVADNGPGIAESIRRYLFQPGYSLKIPPSGLGLYICKYYMHDMNGYIYEAPQKDRLLGFNGAQFILDFEKVSSNQEDTNG